MPNEIKEITEKELNALLDSKINKIVDEKLGEKSAEEKATMISEIIDEVKTGIKEISDKKELSDEEKAEKSAKFIKDFVKGDKAELKAISRGESSAGYLVPTELANQIVIKKGKFSVIRTIAGNIVKLAGTLDLPLEGTAVTAYWVADNAEVTESNPTVTKKTLSDYYLACRVLIPRALLNASAFSIVDFVANLSARALSETEESAFVAGDGSDKPTGIRVGVSASIAQAGDSLAISDVSALYFGLKPAYRKNAVWLTSNAGMILLDALVDTKGNRILDFDKMTMKNRPVYESENIPSNLGVGTDETEIYFFDPFYYWIKDGEEMFIEEGKINSNLQKEVIIGQAVDGVYTLTEAGKKLTGVK